MPAVLVELSRVSIQGVEPSSTRRSRAIRALADAFAALDVVRHPGHAEEARKKRARHRQEIECLEFLYDIRARTPHQRRPPRPGFGD